MEKAIIFGAGQNFEKYRERIEGLYEIVAIVDNNWEQKRICGREVYPQKFIYETAFDKIIITPTDSKEIINQLLRFKILESKIIFLMQSEISFCSFMIGYKTYAQHYEDLILAAIFGQIGIFHPTYMDLGANHPINISNTAIFYENGCRGINIEANPMCMEAFHQMRHDDMNLNIGIADKKGVLPFYKVDNTSGLNSFSLQELQKSHLQPKETMMIEVSTLNDIVEKYCPDGFPDLLDCDIEGLDYAVLWGTDFANVGPKVICVEVKSNEIDKFDDMMKAKDYFRFCRIGVNNIYVRNEYSSVLCYLDQPR